MSTKLSVKDKIAIISLENPPVNSLSVAVVKSLMKNFQLAQNDPNVKGVVITGGQNFFSGGAEISEFEIGVKTGTVDDLTKGLHDLISTIDKSEKTVVAAINGPCLGGGLELALGCHYRIGTEKSTLGFPEINLGILPGGQGTQRTPRLCPLEFTAQLILGGMNVAASAAQKKGLLCQVVKNDHQLLLKTCFEAALNLKPRRLSEAKPRTKDVVMLIGGGLDMALVQFNKIRKNQQRLAVEKIGECLRAALDPKMSFEKGCEVERANFKFLVQTVQSKALRHVFFSERLTGRVEGTPRPIKKVGIVGSGLMGGGIAMCFANKSIPVVLLDAKKEWLENGLKVIKGNYMATVAKKKLSEEAAAKRIGLIKGTLNYEDFGDVDIVIEAVFEDVALKTEIFKKLDSVCKKGALLCTNTSGLDIEKVALATKRPEDVMGTHFFSPANVMKLLENVKTKLTSPDAIATGMQMGKLIGKVTVLVGNCDGFVGNRMCAPYSAETRQLIEEGAHPQRIEDVIGPDGFGMPMGPVSLGDLVGHELFYRTRKALGNMQLDTKTCIGPHDLTDFLCERKRFGQKTKKGFYNYEDKNNKKIDKEVLEGIAEVSRKKNIRQRNDISDKEITERLFFGLINEGFKLLEMGMARRPSDIDVILIYGYGFPASMGGPMFYADNFVGLKYLLEKLEIFDKQMKERVRGNAHYRYNDYFEPSKLLKECVTRNLPLEEMWKIKSKSNRSRL